MKIIRGSQQPFVPASHEDPNDPGVLKKVLLQDGDWRAGRVQMVNWALLPRGRSFRPHYHEDMQELFVIMTGEVEMRVGGELARLARGDAILVDPAEVHQMSNVSPVDVEYLVLGVSAGRAGKTVLA